MSGMSGSRERMSTERGVSHLVFAIGAVTFAVKTVKVAEIIVLQELARTPSLPPCIRGLMNLRGTVLPVIDLSVKFGGKETVVDQHTCVVVVETLHDGVTTPLGLITDEVFDVMSIVPSAIEPPPAFGAAVDVTYLSGMIRYGEGFALLMDADRVLSVDELLGTRSDASESEPS